MTMRGSFDLALKPGARMPAGGMPYHERGGKKAGGKSANNPRGKHKGAGKKDKARNKQGGKGKGSIVKGGGKRTGPMRVSI